MEVHGTWWDTCIGAEGAGQYHFVMATLNYLSNVMVTRGGSRGDEKNKFHSYLQEGQDRGSGEL